MHGDAGRWAIEAIEAIETIEAIEGYRIYRGDSTAWVAETVAEAGTCLPYDAVAFFAVGVFFFAKRLFFRNGEGGEWRASRVTVGVKAKDNGGACFPLDFGITHT